MSATSAQLRSAFICGASQPPMSLKGIEEKAARLYPDVSIERPLLAVESRPTRGDFDAAMIALGVKFAIADKDAISAKTRDVASLWDALDAHVAHLESRLRDSEGE